MNKKQLIWLFLIGLLVMSMIQVNGAMAGRCNDAIHIVLPNETVALYPPFEIVSTVMFRDGGTIRIVVKDSTTKCVPFCLDGRTKRPSEERQLFIGAPHPSDSKAHALPIGASAERSILRVLKTATAATASPSVRTDLVKTVIATLEGR